MKGRSLLSALAAALLALVLAACGGSSDNGVAAKAPDQIVQQVLSAVDSAKSLRMAGNFSNNGMPLAVTLDVLSGQGGRGHFESNGAGFKMVEVNQTVYINADNAFWRRFGGPTAASLLQGRWLKAPDTGQFAYFAKLTDIRQLLGGLGTHGKLVKGARTTIDGRPALTITDQTKRGTLYVATTGKPYPLRLTAPSTGQYLDFSHFDEPVTLSAPANAIDVSQLAGA